jgi:putative peptidoglycan lipid II flippase
MTFFRSMAAVSGLTLVSRFLGYFRDVMIGSIFGDSGVSDVFFQAFRLPNLFRRLFAEGALNAAFVPIFSRLNEHANKRAALKFTCSIFTILTAILIGLILVFEWWMPEVMALLAPGFQEIPHKFKLVVDLGRIVFPYILFISLAALCAAVLNSLHKFATATASPILLNVFCIIALLWPAVSLTDTSTILSWSVMVAGVAQLAWVLMSCYRLGFPLKFCAIKLTPEVKLLLRRMGPGIASAGVYQINLLVSNSVASFVPMAVSYLAYADRINQFPLSVIGIAIGTVLLPLLSQQLGRHEYQQANSLENRIVQFSCFLTFPATAALFCISLPVIITLFQHGRFTFEMSREVAGILSIYILSLPSNVMIKVLSTSFFARHNTFIPMTAASVSIGSNLILTFLLFHFFSYYGIAAAAVISSWINVVILVVSLVKKTDFTFDFRLKSALLRLLLASLGMGGILQLILPFVLPYFGREIFYDFVLLAGYMAIGLGIYLLLVWLLKGFTRQEFNEAMNKTHESEKR